MGAKSDDDNRLQVAQALIEELLIRHKHSE